MLEGLLALGQQRGAVIAHTHVLDPSAVVTFGQALPVDGILVVGLTAAAAAALIMKEDIRHVELVEIDRVDAQSLTGCITRIEYGLHRRAPRRGSEFGRHGHPGMLLLLALVVLSQPPFRFSPAPDTQGCLPIRTVPFGRVEQEGTSRLLLLCRCGNEVVNVGIFELGDCKTNNKGEERTHTRRRCDLLRTTLGGPSNRSNTNGWNRERSDLGGRCSWFDHHHGMLLCGEEEKCGEEESREKKHVG